MMNGILAVKRSSSSCEGSIERSNLWIRPFGSLEDESVLEKGTAEKQSMVPPLSAGFRDKDVGPWDLWIWLNPFFDFGLLDLPCSLCMLLCKRS